MSDTSTCPAAVLPPGSIPSSRFFRPVPLARLVSVIGMTAWTVGSLSLGPEPQITLHRWARSILRCLGVKIEIRGRLREGPRLWVSNHLSWLDPLVLLSLRPMGALAKSEVARYPLIGRASRRLGLAFVDRMNATSRASAVVRLATDLREGKPMLLFPEGTTTLGHGLAPLQEGGLRVAYRCGVAVQTMHLSSEDPGYPWIGEDALLPHLMKMVRASATRVCVRAGEVLEPARFPREDEWITAIRQQLTPTPRRIP